MATGQTILDRMELLHPELQLQTGEADVTRGLIAANMAQDYMESVFALHPGIFGDSVGTVTTTASTETTTFPTGVIRLDKVQRLDSNGRVVADLEPVRSAGGHAPNSDWLTTASGVTAAPRYYWTNGRAFYFDPIPDAAYTLRWTGLQQQTDLTASGTVLYPDICLSPLAAFAVKVLRTGLDDDPTALASLASELFEPVVAALSNFRREGPQALMYRQFHTT